MNRVSAALIIASLGVTGVWFSPADAAPPTVTPSPGYDARLQQSRAGASGPTVYDPGGPAISPAFPRHRLKRTHVR
jgi:hypothetical protein